VKNDSCFGISYFKNLFEDIKKFKH